MKKQKTLQNSGKENKKGKSKESQTGGRRQVGEAIRSGRKECASPKGYDEKEIAEMIAAAIKAFPTLTHISHILPRAYCIAKPAPCCAVFVVPPEDREPQTQCDGTIFVQEKEAFEIETGDWARLAYIQRPEISSMSIIPKKRQIPRGKISEELLKLVSETGTVRICVRALGKGFEINGYKNEGLAPVPFSITGDCLETLIDEMRSKQLKAEKKKRK